MLHHRTSNDSADALVHPIPLFYPCDAHIPVPCLLPKFSGLVSQCQGSEGYTGGYNPKLGNPDEYPHPGWALSAP